MVYLSSRPPISTRKARVLKDLGREWRNACVDCVTGRILQGSLDISSMAKDPLLMYEVSGGEDTDAHIAK